MGSGPGRIGDRLEAVARGVRPRADSGWHRFRRWPVSAQIAAWLVGFVILLPILLWRSAIAAKAKVVLTAVLLVIVVAALVSPANSKQKTAGLAPEPSQSGSPSQPPAPTTPTYSMPSASPTVQPFALPIVFGLSAKSAKAVLKSLAIKWTVKYQFVGEDQVGIVLNQSPGAGSRVLPNLVVSLTVGKAGSNTPGAVTCPTDSLLGVYHSYRLTVLGTCRWFVGVVTKVTSEKDGDYHVNVAPDKGYTNLLNDGDREHQGGALVTEIMKGQDLPVPFLGEHVSVFGTWVLDEDHGWNEIHPIWAIKYLDTGELVNHLPPATPEYNPDEGGGGGGGGGGSGGNCDPNYSGYCLKDGIGDWDCAGGSGNGPNYVPVRVEVIVLDVFGLDSDNDGFGCDSLPPG